VFILILNTNNNLLINNYQLVQYAIFTVRCSNENCALEFKIINLNYMLPYRYVSKNIKMFIFLDYIKVCVFLIIIYYSINVSKLHESVQKMNKH
jgi:hypothetical protein